MANAKKRCRSCKKYDLVESGIKVPLGWFCSMACVVEHGKKGATVSSEKRKRETLTKLRSELKTASEWRVEAQSAFNAYIRWRDRDESCISCDSVANRDNGYWDAGHFHSRGARRELSFNLWNTHKQCHRCNRYLSSNPQEYRKRLIIKIGIERVEALDQYAVVRHDITYLRRIKQIFKAKIKLKIKLTRSSIT